MSDAITRDPRCSERISKLSCTSLQDNPLRMQFYNQKHLETLTRAIKKDGLLEPLLVFAKDQEGCYEILSGHYRVRALRRNKERYALCRIWRGDANSAVQIFCSSYFLSRFLNPIEEAHIMKGLLEMGNTMAEIGAMVGHTKSWVSRRLKLIKDLDPQILLKLKKEKVLPRTALEISKLPQGNQQIRVLKIIEREKMTKDEAAEFIHWWQEATEKEREEVEHSTISTKRTSKQVAKALLFCNKSLLSLNDFVKEHGSNLAWWPQEEWRTLYSSFQQFTQTVRTLEKEGEAE